MAYSVQDYLTEQSPQIGTDINQKMLEQPTPWISLVKQEMWEDEKSSTQKTFQFDRALLEDANDFEVSWDDVAGGITGFADDEANQMTT